MQLVSFERAAEQLARGDIGVLPTDTVYGVVAALRYPAAVTRLFRVKPRDGKPGTVIAASIEDLVPYGVARSDLQIVSRYWPGPISVVVNHQADEISQGKETIAVRIPEGEALQGLLRVTGPLMTSSANMPGEPTAESIDAAIDYFGDTVDFYVDGGSMAQRQPSTIVQVIDDELVVLRQGSVIIKEQI